MRQKKVEVNGVEYTLQSLPFRSYTQLIDRCTNKHGVLLKEHYTTEMLKHVVVSPKVTMESFDDDFRAATELLQEIEGFLQQPAETKEKSKKE